MKQAPPIPYTRSKHPLVILKAVIKTILDDPKRYNQEMFLLKKESSTLSDAKFPACGTIACVAGWVCLVTSRSGEPPYFAMTDGEPSFAMTAARLLKLTPGTCSELFDGGALYGLPGGAGYGETTPRRYARLGVRHILRFAKQTWGQAAADYLKGKITRPPRITEVR